MKRPTLAVRRYRHSATHPYYLDLRAFGQGRKFFKTRAEADVERLRQVTLRERGGNEAVGLPLTELSAIIKARRELAAYGASITEASAFYLDHLKRVRRCDTTISDLAREVLDAKQKDGRAPTYLADLRKRLARFVRDFGTRALTTITTRELDSWLRNLDCAPKTRANFRANVGVLFSYAEQMEMIDTNPIRRTARPKVVDKAPDIFSVDSLRALLDAAQAESPDIVPMLAIGAFAGLREAEIKRLNWSEVDLRRNFIEVTALKAKSARRRIVKIQPNLAAWLAPLARGGEMVVPMNARAKLDAVRRAAGLKDWPGNGLRHSFASFRLAAIHDSAAVATELGHRTSQMLYSTYRELVLPEDAERYWAIMPTTAQTNIVSFGNRRK